MAIWLMHVGCHILGGLAGPRRSVHGWRSPPEPALTRACCCCLHLQVQNNTSHKSFEPFSLHKQCNHTNRSKSMKSTKKGKSSFPYLHFCGELCNAGQKKANLSITHFSLSMNCLVASPDFCLINFVLKSLRSVYK